MPPDKAAATLDEQLREACALLDERLRAGESARTEDVLDEFPELASRPEFILELAYTEFVARDALGESPDIEEWFARFPDLRQDLRELFEVHRFVEQSAEETLGPHGAITDDVKRQEPLPTAELEPDADRRFGNYELIEEVGRGGMGVVYKARQRGLGRIVALKLILAGEHAGRDRYERFQAEAETVARLAHPNIVHIHEVGAEEGRPFLSLEFVAGGSLDRQRPGEPWPAREAAALAATIALAMQHAHERGIVHRDLKPANVLMTSDGVPKITDFGLAKRLFDEQSGRTASGAMLGTPSYMAPEQALGNSRDSGAAADVYALGAILYELLTGRPPFLGATLLETLEQVRTQEPVGPRQLIGKLPRDLETICLKCLQKQPQHRYATAAALAEDLQRFLENRPIQARPVNAAERLIRWSARNPMLATLAASLAVLILTALVVGPLVALKQVALKHEVQRQLVATKASLLAARSRMAADDAPQRSVLLAAEGIQTLRDDRQAVTATNEQALRDALARSAGVGLAGHRGPLSTVVFSPDSNSAITAGADGTVRIWPAASEQPPKVLTAHRGPVRSSAISASGRWLVTAGDDGVARVWDLRATDIEASLVELADFHEPLVIANISRDDRWLFVGDRAGAGKLYAMSDSAAPSLAAAIDVKLPILAAAFCPDGKWLAVGGADKLTHVWPLHDQGLGEEIVFSGHEGAISALAFDPHQPRLATASAGRVVRVWDLPRGAQSREASHSAMRLPSLAGRGQGEGRSAAQWWLEDLQIRQAQFENRVLQQSSPFHPPPTPPWKGGESVVEDPSMPDHATRSTKDTPVVLAEHRNHVSCVAFSPDGRWLVSAGYDGTVRRWDLSQPDWTTTPTVLTGNGDRVFSLAISADSQWLATGSRNKLVCVWKLTADDPNATLRTLRGHDDAIHAVAFSRDATRLASASADGTARLYDVRAGLPSSAANRSYRHGETKIQQLAVSPSGRWLASSGNDAVVRVWDRTAGREFAALPHDGPARFLAFSADDRWFVTVAMAREPRAPQLWDLQAKPGERTPVELRGNTQAVECLAIDPLSRWVLTGSQCDDGQHTADGAVRRWALSNAAAGARDGEVLARHKADIRWLTVSANGEELLSVDATGGIGRSNLSHVESPATAISPPELAEGVRSFAAFPNGRQFATIDLSGELRLWKFGASRSDPPSSTLLLDRKRPTREVAVSQDGSRLAALDAGGRVLVYRFDDQHDLATEVKQPAMALSDAKSRGGALGCVISPDNRHLATFAKDGTVRIWMLESPERGPIVLAAHTLQVQAAHFTPDSRTLITAGYDGMIHEWPLEMDDLLAQARRAAGRELTELERRQDVDGEGRSQE